jgi:hypothetical protein
MKSLINFVKGLLAFVAVYYIATGSAMPRGLPPSLVLWDYILTALRAASVVYLHYLMAHYLIPLHEIEANQRDTLLKGAHDYYSSSFFKGTIATGYVFLGIYIILYLATPRSVLNFLIPAIFLIALGVFAKSRGVTLQLIKHVVAAQKGS